MAAEAPTTRYELLDYVPAADPRATVVVGDARFTVLTPRVLRMEYRGAAIFEDRPTLAFVNRRQPVPPFKWHAAAGALTTGFLRLRYTGGPFSADSLWVEPAPAALRGMGAFGGWRFGQRDASNLRGTIRTLDRKNNVSLSCDGGASAGGAGGGAGGGGGGSSGGGNGSGWAVVDLDSSGHCTWGVVSRSGWALVNDTGAPCLDAADDWWADETGVMLRNRNRHDLYLFAHGADFRGALRDFTAVGGAVPLPPRYQLGVLFSRWYDYDTEGVQSLVRQFERRRLPLDGLILDMSWHTKPAWTGYTWDGHLYPDPADLTGWLRRRGLAVGANLHDAGGVGAWEASYARVAAAMGVILGAGVPLSLTNKTCAAGGGNRGGKGGMPLAKKTCAARGQGEGGTR
jgi:alpha-glucosidase